MSIVETILSAAAAASIVVVCRVAARQNEEIMRRAGFPVDPPRRRWRLRERRG